MINAMKYKEEISNVGYDFGILEKNNKIVGCGSCADEMKCQKCKFGYDEQGRSCDITRTEWLCQEYKEPIKLTRLEYEILKYYFKYGYRYIARNGNSDLLVFVDFPERRLNGWFIKSFGDEWDKIRMDEFFHFRDTFFDFARSYDKELYKIKDILDNCEVVENAN